MLPIIYACGAALLYGVLPLLQHHTVKSDSDQRYVTIVFNIISTFFSILLIISLAGGVPSPVLPSSLLGYIAVFSTIIGYGFFERYRYAMSLHISPDMYAIISNITPVTAVTLSVFVYQESFSLTKIFAILLVLLSVAAATTLENKAQKNSHAQSEKKWLYISALIFAACGLAWSMDKANVQTFGSHGFTIWAWLLGLPVVLFPYVSLSRLTAVLRKSIKSIALTSACNVIAYYCALQALQGTSASTVIPIVQTSSVWSVLMSALLLKNTSYILQKIFLALLCALAIGMLQF